MCAIRMRPTSGSAASTTQIGKRGMPIPKLWRPRATKLASRTHGNDRNESKINKMKKRKKKQRHFLYSFLFLLFILYFSLHHSVETDLKGWTLPASLKPGFSKISY